MRQKRVEMALRRWSLALALFTLLSAVLPTPALGASRANRIRRALGTSARIQVAGSVHPLVRRSTDMGPVNPQMVLNPVTLNFGLSAAQQQELDALLAAQHNPASPQYHQWLTQEQYGARFGMTDADLAQVQSWLESQGLTVTGVSRSRNAMYFSGRAWQVESAFHTQLHQYQRNGKQHFANATDVQMPADLAAVTLTVRGLDNFRPRAHSVARPKPAYTVDTTAGLKHFLSPADWATIYNVNDLYAAGFTGTGAYVGVVGQTYAPQSDIDNFRSAAGLSSTKLDYVCISQTVNCTNSAAISSAGDLLEADLDIEWAGGIARDATVTYVYAAYSDPSQGVLDALQYAVQNYTVPATGDVLPVVSMSYDTCESAVPSSYLDFLSALGAQANSQGQSLIISSGDTGTVCVFDTGYPATMGESASVPPSSPFFTGVGGTTFSGDQSSPDTYWDQTPDLVNSALKYIPEVAWNDSAENNSLSASGGGVSQHFAQPDGTSAKGGFTQPTPSNFSGTPGRFVPDISFAASANHDGYVICSQDNDSPITGTDCASGFISSKSFLDIVGGTSVGAPSFAGMLALLTQRFGPQGNINVLLYGLAADAGTYASVFHDVTSGDNIVACSGGDGCVGGTMGYETATGYDLVTGLGSINGGALYAAMGPPLNATTTSVSASPNPVVLNATTTLTATVTSVAAGTITGTVTFRVGSTTVGTATVSGGTATLSNVAASAANGFSGGAVTVTATYGGDAAYAASSGNTQVTVQSFSISAPSSVVMNAGAETSVTLNLTSSNYSGAVSFSVTSSNPSQVTGSAPATTLTSNGGGFSGSTTLNITAAATAASHTPALPWKRTGALAFAFVLGIPFTLRKRRGARRALTGLLVLLAFSLAGLAISCGGKSSTPARTAYTLTVTPQPNAGSPVAITVYVQ